MGAQVIEFEGVGKAVDPEIIRIDMDATVVNKPIAARGETIFCAAGQATISLGARKDPPLLQVQVNSFIKFCQPFEKLYVSFAGVAGPLYLLIWPPGAVDRVSGVSVYAP